MDDQELRRLCELMFDHIHATSLSDVAWSHLEEAVDQRRRDLRADFGPHGALLPLLLFHLFDSASERALPLAAAWTLYDLASDILDDLADQDQKERVWNGWRSDEMMMTGLGVIFAANGCLARLQTDAESRTAIEARLAQVGLVAAKEQIYRSDVRDVSVYLRHIAGKSGVLFAGICWSGIRLATDSADVLRTASELGRSLGMLVQLRDDILDSISLSAQNDLHQGMYTLPVLYGLSRSDHPSVDRLAELCQRADGMNRELLGEVRDILFEMKAYDFCASVVRFYAAKAKNCLEQLGASDADPLHHYVNHLETPFGARKTVERNRNGALEA